jgi:cyclohexanone monooxygenase
MDPDVEREWKADYPRKRAFARASGFGHNQVANPKSGKEVSPPVRQAELENRWRLGGLYMMRAFRDILTDKEVNDEASEFVREKIRRIVADPRTADALLPRGLPLGTKRLCSGTNYYETFNRSNVTLVDLKAHPIDRIVPRGVRTTEGEYDLDVLVYATGFDAMTGALNRLNPLGRGGRSLREYWADGPRTYLGLSVAGFPNMFIIAGPGSPSVFSNMVTSIEQHVEWIADAISYMEAQGIGTIEASESAEADWVQHVNDAADQTLYRDSKETWFYGANTPGKPVVFMPYVGGVGNYARRIAAVAQAGYAGFLTDGSEPAAAEADGASAIAEIGV